jgi:hypothetical protein
MTLPCAALHIHHDHGSIEDVHEQLVRRKSSVDFLGDVPSALTFEVGEDHEYRRWL